MARYLTCKNKKIVVDAEGFLRNLDDWDEEVACCLAQESGIRLTDAHWEIIRLVRSFYLTHELSPPMRALVNITRLELGNEKGRSIYIMKLFGGSAARACNKIAGLPRPNNCL